MQHATRSAGWLATFAVALIANGTPPALCRAGDPSRGDRDDIQVQSLFDAVRMAIPKLKAGTSWPEARQLLKIDKLESGMLLGSLLGSTGHFEFPGNKEQKLLIQIRTEGSGSTLRLARLLDHKCIVAEFDEDKK